ncbi:MAG: beta-galactosidase [Bryobacterales bacterium]|nr:beta-galactosidase [Bryobacterales bacterium]
MRRRSLLAAAALAPAPLCAQDVGMGARRGPSSRLETPYRMDIETPHVKWANPLPGGPLRLLAAPSVSEGRTAIELAQRLSLDLTTVSIDPEWDVNKWTMCFGRDYGARAERGDLKLIYSYLEQELTSEKHFDVILLPLAHGWKELTEASRAAIGKRVESGCGLVLMRPFSCPYSPLEAEGGDDGPWEKAAWKRTGEHYIARAIPVETFPWQFVEQHKARLRAGSQALLQSANGTPLLAVREQGQGRVAAFGCRSYGLSWRMPFEARHHAVDVYWEYFYALLCRTLMWAAKREPKGVADWSKGEWRVRDRFGAVVRQGRGGSPDSGGLLPGRYFLERQAGAEWDIAARDVEGSDRIDGLTVTPTLIREGAAVQVSFQATGKATVELVDGLGRVLAKGSGADGVTLQAGRSMVHSGLVRVTAGSATEVMPVHFEAASREWTDYEVVLPWSGPRSYQPWMKALDEQLRRIGVTTLASPERNFRFMVSSHLNAFGIYWYRRDNYLKRKKLYAETRDKKHLTREVVLQSPDFEASVRKQFEGETKRMAALKPFAYYLADESSLTCYTDAFDVDWAPEAIAGLRQWLKAEYGGLQQLNAAWGTRFASWEAVLPMTAEEAQKHGNFAPWADHRIYMEREFVRAFGKARDWLKEIDPGARPSISGTQVPTAHNGCDWYSIDQELEYIQPYSGGGQDAMHYLFNPKLRITGFTGYGATGDEARYMQWQRLFYGHSGASIFWHYTMLNPDLTFSEQGSALAEAFGKMQSGIGRVFLNSRVVEDGVAVHFSMASIRGAWITDGVIQADMGNAMRSSKSFAELSKRRTAWVKELEDQGVAFRFLATQQIERGELDRYKVLILPYSIALSDKEIEAISRFMERGGRVFADEQAGRMDERCRWRKAAPWPGLERKGAGSIGVKPALGVEGAFLRTVREFGASKLYGLLPRETTRVTLPRMEGVTYDLLRGGEAAAALKAGPGEPVLLLVRPARIAKLSCDASLGLRLTDEKGEGVDLSVVRVRAFDGRGREARHYAGNVWIENGSGKIEIPFALSDAGEWTIRMRDAVSGMTAERRVRV